MSTEGNRIEPRFLSAIVSDLRPDQYQWRPYFPDLLNQPRLLLSPKPGKLVAIYLYSLKRPRTWQSTLAAVEDLFAAKLSLGERTLVLGIALNNAPVDEETKEMASLLHNTFDGFVETRNAEPKGISRYIRRNIASGGSKQHFQLWRGEREYVGQFLKRFREDKFSDLVEADYKPKFERVALSRLAEATLRKLAHERLEIAPLVTSIKTSLGRLKGVHRLRFDFRIPGEPGEPAKLIEVFQSERYGSREKLRYLMAKARLVRYWVERGQIERVPQATRLFLFVDGSLAGPDHDPFRYIRALSSVGWEIHRVDQHDSLVRMLRANV